MMLKRGEVSIYAMIECVDSSSWEVSSSSVGMRPAQEPYVYLSVSDLDQPPDGDLKIFNVPPPRRSRHRQPVEIGSHSGTEICMNAGKRKTRGRVAGMRRPHLRSPIGIWNRDLSG